MNIHVRPASTADIPWLLSQLKKFSEFFGSKIPLFEDEAHSTQGLHSMICDHVVFIAEQDGVGSVGFISGWRTQHPFNPKIRWLAETFWWVDEPWRGTRAGLMLLNKFTEWGKQNADWITFGLEENSPINDKTLIKRGFRLHERSYLMEVS